MCVQATTNRPERGVLTTEDNVKMRVDLIIVLLKVETHLVKTS